MRSASIGPGSVLDMKLCLGTACPIVDLRPAGEPQTPVPRPVQERLAQFTLGCTKGNCLEACAVITPRDQPDMVAADNIGPN